MEEIRLRTEALKIKRQREGQWSGGVQAHVAYQKKPLEWIVEFMGIPESTLKWSLNPGYARCECDTEVCSHVDHPGPHEWDGDADPIVKILEALANWEDCGVESATGTGKAQWINANVLTPRGWKRMGDVVVGDEVVGQNGRPTRVLAVYPQGIRSIYRVRFSDGAESLVDAEHLWNVRDRHQKNKGLAWRTMTTAEIKHQIHRRWEIPIVQAVQFPERDFPIDPYLLGALLGDGGFRANSPTLSSADSEILEYVRASLPAGIELKHSSAYDYRLCAPRNGGKANPLTAILRELGLYGLRSEHKHIPEEYLLGSVDQRIALLQGLMDTDGHVEARFGTSFIFTSASRQLAEGVQALVRSLGGTAPIREKATSALPSFMVQFQLPNEINPFRLPRKADRVRPRSVYGLPRRVIESIEFAFNDEAQCIRVDAADSLYVVDDYVVTHNTFLAALIVFWFLATHENSLVFTAAPRGEQLLLGVWKEIGDLWPRFQRHFPQAELLSGKIRMQPADGSKEKWAASAFVCGVGADEESATRAQGLHAEHMLIITEETPGIHSAIMNAFENTRSDDHNLQLSLGNPDSLHDSLHQFCMQEHVVHVRISALDHPNIVCRRSIIGGAIGPKRLARRTLKYPKGSRLYQSRIRGISPAESADALIRWEWCTAAAKKWAEDSYRQGEHALGIDVANSEGGDKAAIARWQGACLTEVESFACPDASKLGERVALEARAEKIDPRYIGIDSVGVGASAINKMREMGLKVRHISGGRKAVPGVDTDTLWSETEADLEGSIRPSGPTIIEAERFLNLRSQVWWRLREDLRLGRVALPDDESLFMDLTTPQFTTNGSVIVVEKKEDIVKRLKRSPDKGDAAAYGNFVRRRTPTREVTKEELRSTPNRDFGLEKKLYAHQKAAAKEERKFKRMLATRARSKKR